jgi:hypothetical protein
MTMRNFKEPWHLCAKLARFSHILVYFTFHCLAVTKFFDKSAKHTGKLGDGMAEMLRNSLSSIRRNVVLAHQS